MRGAARGRGYSVRATRGEAAPKPAAHLHTILSANLNWTGLSFFSLTLLLTQHIHAFYSMVVLFLVLLCCFLFAFKYLRIAAQNIIYCCVLLRFIGGLCFVWQLQYRQRNHGPNFWKCTSCSWQQRDFTVPLLGLTCAVSQGVRLSLLHITPARLQTPNDAAARSLSPEHTSSVQPVTGKPLPQETLSMEVSVPSASPPQAGAAEKGQNLLSHAQPTSVTHRCQHLCNY